MPYGMGPWGFIDPYAYPHWGRWGWRCRWFPWLPRWLWATPMRSYRIPPIPKENEIAILEEEAKMLEGELAEIKERLGELKK